MKYLINLALILFFSTYLKAQKNTTYLFTGTYTNGLPDKGIYIYKFNSETGELTLSSTTQNITNPSYLNLSPDGKYLYACTDTKLPKHGSVTAFKIDSLNGSVSLINKQSSEGENPVYVSVYKNNRFVVTGNYSEGNVAVLTTNIDGSLNAAVQTIQFSDSSIIKDRQEKSHIHSTIFSPKNDYLYLPDLGADKIRTLSFNAEKTKPLTDIENFTVKSVLGSGPRHLTFHPSKNFAYCIEELSGMVAVYAYKNGKLSPIQRIFSNSNKREIYSSADIHISPDGRFLYASNRDENTISTFSINRNGKLKLLFHTSTNGEVPRNFTLDPSSKFLLVANQKTGNIIVFKRDFKTGMLEKIEKEISVPNPSCLQMRTYKN
jgi:6-phosphogluconolactonase